ncbi:hypothetical protein H6F98_12720 [Microcoleus sp. FACHB-SPT15]|uniref:hypothetical protein n=1 Tax=Microcoleus sp. FACHB-SPT15 TaxID=2692830 RepID=UPI001780A076|nr:hypothetical protein [Microcoleus sp. FACHB-SPT15]MBD1806310.1 hypothetical protein [Microcoleus sp. FACHB-SPT15]
MKPDSITEQDKHTLASLFYKWEKHIQNPNLSKYLKIAFKLYILEASGFKTKDMKSNEFANFCDKLTLQKLMKHLEKFTEKSSSKEENLEIYPPSPKENLKACLLNAFDQQFEAAVALGLVKPSTKHNYRSAVGRFGEYLPQQIWWKELFPQQMPEFIPPRPKKVERDRRSAGEYYGLPLEEFPPHLDQQLDDYKDFRLTGSKKVRRENSWASRQQSKRPKITIISESTLERELNIIVRFLGWYVHIENHSIESLELDLITDIELLENYISWLVEERKCCHSSGVAMLGVAIAVAKWLNYNKSERRNWSDIDLIRNLQGFQNYCNENYKNEKRQYLQSKWENKELTHSQLREVIQYLRDCCAENCGYVSHLTGKRIKGNKRSNLEIIRSWQVYLIVKILVFLPVRQQEIRQLKPGETLLRKKDEKGHPYYEARITHHKNKTRTGRDRIYKLPNILTADLDAWIDILRPKAFEAVQTKESWLEFAGYKIEDVERLQQRIEMAKQGVTERKLEDIQKYIKSLETRLLSLKKRIKAWSSAEANLTEHKSLFFMMGKTYPKSFGKPLSVHGVYSLVTTAIAQATTMLYGEPCWTNPHALRHIAAKHIRKLRGDTKALAELMGHSETQGDEYAAQIMTTLDRLNNFSDNWWEEEDENEND